MEQYFNLHQVPIDKKITLASLHMDTEPFQWYQWMKKKWGGLSYRWDNFMDDIIAQYDNVWEADYFSQLTKIRQIGSMMDYTLKHQKLVTRVDGLDAEKMLELYIGGLKDEIWHELQILGPMDITIAIRMAKQIEAKNRAMRKIVGATSIEGRKHVDTQGS